jgi:uncharacterized protein YraI
MMRKLIRLLTVLVVALVAASLLAWNITFSLAASPAQQVGTETLQPSATYGGPTVFAADQVNIRSGPSTSYDQVGVMIAGQTAPAVGRSQANEWIQIQYPGGPGGKAWVYAPLISIRAGTVDDLPVAEVPATSTVPPTLTSEPGTEQPGTPEPTRQPTFTAGAPIAQPTFQPQDLGGGGFPPALLIIGLFMVGVFAGLMVVLRQRA